MKNIQVIDGADNCVYDIFAATEEEFAVLFPPGQDVAFIEEIVTRVPAERLSGVLQKLWLRRVRKQDVAGTYGLLFYELEHKAIYYPTRRDEEAINPNGSLLRAQT